MNRFVMTLLVSTLASAYTLPALAVDDTATTGTTADASTTGHHGGKNKEFRAKWKSMSKAERKQWKAEHPEEVKKWKEHRAAKRQQKAMKEGSSSAIGKDSIAK